MMQMARARQAQAEANQGQANQEQTIQRVPAHVVNQAQPQGSQAQNRTLRRVQGSENLASSPPQHLQRQGESSQQSQQQGKQQGRR
jgi:hypothetical protein